MPDGIKFSRRVLVGSLATVPLSSVAPSADVGSLSDTSLLALGREFDELSALCDHSVEHDYRLSDETDKRFGEVLDAIEATPASTLEGLQVKARVACWCLLGDLDTPEKATGDQMMVFSILRDLIRIHRPEMEKPAALTKLVEEIENGAG